MARDLGRSVRMAMAYHNISSKELSIELDITEMTMANYRKGKGIDLPKLEKVAEACNLDFELVLSYSE